MGVRKSQTQVTDTKAVDVVKDRYDDMEWTTYDIKPDYGIDQKIEILEKGKHTSGLVPPPRIGLAMPRSLR